MLTIIISINVTTPQHRLLFSRGVCKKISSAIRTQTVLCECVPSTKRYIAAHFNPSTHLLTPVPLFVPLFRSVTTVGSRRRGKRVAARSAKERSIAVRSIACSSLS